MNEFDPTSPDWDDELIDTADDADSDGAEGETSLVAEENDPNAPSSSAAVPPLIPLKLAKRAVSGRYRGKSGSWELELRIDVDGHRPMSRVSGDFFKRNGSTTTYHGSFISGPVQTTWTATKVTIKGSITPSFSSAATAVTVTIPRRSLLQKMGNATIAFILANNKKGASYTCPFVARLFRSVEYEQDYVQGTVPFVSYNVASLPHPGSARVLTVESAFAEAGVQFVGTGGNNVIPVAAAGANAKWSDAEMHSAMQTQFSRWANIPQWKVWLLVATAHDGGYRGIMFDYSDTRQRQGCAVFYDAIQGTGAAAQRAMLRTYVHELGHCFNLLHSFQKSLGSPPSPDRTWSLSWMNYPWRYVAQGGHPSGEAAYWAGFDFEFDDLETLHLRHGFRNHVVPGGSAFGQNAADVDAHELQHLVSDESGLILTAAARRVHVLGEPVTLDIRATAQKPQRVPGDLSPDSDGVEVFVITPSGRAVQYRPLIWHCSGADDVYLQSGDTIGTTAMLQRTATGLLFNEVGNYKIRLSLLTPAGDRVLSNVVSVLIRPPVSAAEAAFSEQYLSETGAEWLLLGGTDSTSLQSSSLAFEDLANKYATEPLSAYAHLALGTNSARNFKTLSPRDGFVVRPANYDVAEQHAGKVVQLYETGANIPITTCVDAYVQLAIAQGGQGNGDQAKKSLAAATSLATASGLNTQGSKITTAIAQANSRLNL